MTLDSSSTLDHLILNCYLESSKRMTSVGSIPSPDSSPYIFSDIIYFLSHR